MHCPTSITTSGTAPGSGRSLQARSAAVAPTATVTSNIPDRSVRANTDTGRKAPLAIKRAEKSSHRKMYSDRQLTQVIGTTNARTTKTTRYSHSAAFASSRSFSYRPTSDVTPRE